MSRSVKQRGDAVSALPTMQPPARRAEDGLLAAGAAVLLAVLAAIALFVTSTGTAKPLPSPARRWPFFRSSHCCRPSKTNRSNWA